MKGFSTQQATSGRKHVNQVPLWVAQLLSAAIFQMYISPFSVIFQIHMTPLESGLMGYPGLSFLSPLA